MNKIVELSEIDLIYINGGITSSDVVGYSFAGIGLFGGFVAGFNMPMCVGKLINECPPYGCGYISCKMSVKFHFYLALVSGVVGGYYGAKYGYLIGKNWVPEK